MFKKQYLKINICNGTDFRKQVLFSYSWKTSSNEVETRLSFSLVTNSFKSSVKLSKGRLYLYERKFKSNNIKYFDFNSKHYKILKRPKGVLLLSDIAAFPLRIGSFSGFPSESLSLEISVSLYAEIPIFISSSS